MSKFNYLLGLVVNKVVSSTVVRNALEDQFLEHLTLCEDIVHRVEKLEKENRELKLLVSAMPAINTLENLKDYAIDVTKNVHKKLGPSKNYCDKEVIFKDVKEIFKEIIAGK